MLVIKQKYLLLGTKIQPTLARGSIPPVLGTLQCQNYNPNLQENMNSSWDDRNTPKSKTNYKATHRDKIEIISTRSFRRKKIIYFNNDLLNINYGGK